MLTRFKTNSYQKQRGMSNFNTIYKHVMVYSSRTELILIAFSRKDDQRNEFLSTSTSQHRRDPRSENKTTGVGCCRDMFGLVHWREQYRRGIGAAQYRFYLAR